MVIKSEHFILVLKKKKKKNEHQIKENMNTQKEQTIKRKQNYYSQKILSQHRENFNF